MSDDRLDMGRADIIDVEALGEPGNRRFRIFARSEEGTASLWMEREQLEALSLALDQVLAEVSGGDVLRPEALATIPTPPGAPSDFPRYPTVEFQVANMLLGYDDHLDLLMLRAAPLELVEEDGELTPAQDPESRLSVLFTRRQATWMNSHLLGILAGGRPRCPFCGRPMENPHVCAKQNGYHPAQMN